MSGLQRIAVRASAGIWLLAFTLAVAGCAGPEEPDGAVDESEEQRSASPADVLFVDEAAAAGLDHQAIAGSPNKDYILGSLGNGVAVADYDGDGDEDLYFTTAQTNEDWLAGRRPRANGLYRNHGDGTFSDVAEQAGAALRIWSSGASFIDYDGDGDKDLFVTAWGPNVLLRNQGDGTFRDATAVAGLAGPEDAWSVGAAFGDLDGDGDLDLYVTNYCKFDLDEPPHGGAKIVWMGVPVFEGPHGLVGQHDLLYRNDGDGTFSEVGEAAGITAPVVAHYGLALVMSDLDDDGDLDIYVANDSRPNLLWRNDGGMRFVDVAPMAGVATNEDAKEQAGMSADAGDYDGDLLLDLMVTNFSHDWNTLYRNRGKLFFMDDTFAAGFRDSYVRLVWGAKFLDYDNDGWLDVVTANGHIYPQVDTRPALGARYREANTLYRNRGDGTFDNVTERSGSGFSVVDSTRAVAAVDVERDGDLDLVLTNIDSRPNLLINQGSQDGPGNHWIAFRLSAGNRNPDAIGARLVIEAEQRRQVREINPFGSYLAQGSYRAHFGLGAAERIDRLTIRWPSGTVEEIGALEADHFYLVTEGRGEASVEDPAP